MKLKLDEPTRRLLRFLPRGDVYSWLELALLVALAIQLARLAWVILTPIGPVGEWSPRQANVPSLAARTDLFGSFDPFFRTQVNAAAAVNQVTSLDIKLFGVRVNAATGDGSAIIAGPDGVQNSIGVGEQIIPGVTLKEVLFDHVIVDRGGNQEVLYLDQSVAAVDASNGVSAAAPLQPQAAEPPAASAPVMNSPQQVPAPPIPPKQDTTKNNGDQVIAPTPAPTKDELKQ